MKSNSGASLWSYVAIIAICVVLTFVFYPAFTHHHCGSPAPRCQSNMNQLGKAVKSYMTDWDDHFPTNRRWKGKLSANVPLTVDNQDDRIFDSGPNWVEALYSYVEKVGNPGDNASVWKCPNAHTRLVGRKNACVSYAINMNLLEQPEEIIRDAGHTMLLRELDGVYDAVCRPMNISKDGKTQPICPFLTIYDPQLPKDTAAKANLHGSGSNILFTDGHVKNIPASLMSADDRLYWDDTTKQWWNAEEEVKRIVAITP